MTSTQPRSHAARVAVLDGTSPLDRTALGGKAFGVNVMRRLGLPVPPAFALPTGVCHEYLASGHLPDDVEPALRQGMAVLEEATGRRFGDPTRPLLVSVRSGSAVSMPGMMDTVLNLGINDAVEAALIAASGDPEWVADTRHRFAEQHRSILPEGQEPAASPWGQLLQAVEAVFRSWNSPRARTYRAHHGIDDTLGTAVTVQAMVFGNLDETSGTGVVFSRNPLTGKRSPHGEWLPRAQGEDVVSGVRTPLALDALHEALPAVHAELLELLARLEVEGRDVQDVEFTVESGRLYVLQTRTAKRAPLAAVGIAVDMVDEGLIDVDEALRRVTPHQVRVVLTPGISPEQRAVATVVARGEPACPGIASGVVVDDPDTAVEESEDGPVVLARQMTSPADVHGMIASAAIVTEQGGSTSHAALVSRELGVPCVVGCGEGVVEALVGRTVTVDGSTGEVFDGALDPHPADPATHPALHRVVAWATERLGDMTLYPDVASCPVPAVGPQGPFGPDVALDVTVEPPEGTVATAMAAGVRHIVAGPQAPAVALAVARAQLAKG